MRYRWPLRWSPNVVGRVDSYFNRITASYHRRRNGDRVDRRTLQLDMRPNLQCRWRHQRVVTLKMRTSYRKKWQSEPRFRSTSWPQSLSVCGLFCHRPAVIDLLCRITDRGKRKRRLCDVDVLSQVVEVLTTDSNSAPAVPALSRIPA